MSKNIDNLLTESANIITIESEPKVGKLTFTAFLLSSLLKTKALVFTPQDTYLFSRRLKVFAKQFPQLSSIEDDLNVFYLKTDWHHLKQHYGYAFFLSELSTIINNTDEEVIVFHRFGEFFEFQDRYEIEPIFRALIKLCESLGKKIIFMTNTKNENFEFIKNITEEFADVIIEIKIGDNNDRKIFIKDVLSHQHFPPYDFKSKNQKFTLEKFEAEREVSSHEKKRVLIANLASKDDRSIQLVQYLLNYSQQFSVAYADSFQSILNKIFVAPDLIVIMMSHSDANFETIKAIKEHLKEVKIVVVLDQSFIRAEDKRKAFSLGCDELLHSHYRVDDLVMTLEKSMRFGFYEQRLSALDAFPQEITTKKQLRDLIATAQEAALFFTLFKFDILEQTNVEDISGGRQHDYLFKKGTTLCCVKINTCHFVVDKIIENYQRRGIKLSLNCHADALDKDELEKCMK